MRHRRRGGIADATLPGAGLAEWQAPAAGFFLWVKATVTCEGMACEERLRASMAECKVPSVVCDALAVVATKLYATKVP
eukprot:1194471-Prorocentrum_minimum.AAC.5